MTGPYRFERVRDGCVTLYMLVHERVDPRARTILIHTARTRRPNKAGKATELTWFSLPYIVWLCSPVPGFAAGLPGALCSNAPLFDMRGIQALKANWAPVITRSPALCYTVHSHSDSSVVGCNNCVCSWMSNLFLLAERSEIFILLCTATIMR